MVQIGAVGGGPPDEPCKDHHHMNLKTEDLLEELTIGEMNLNIHQMEDLPEEGPLDLQEETLEEDHLDKMVEEVGMDFQEEMAGMEKMVHLDAHFENVFPQ